MNYVLLQVSKTNDNGTVNGVWLQGCCGTTLEEATKRARATEAANSNRITVAVVEDLCFGVTDYNEKKNLKRLDIILNTRLEQLAKTAKNMNSYFDYKEGSATAELNQYISEAEAAAEKAIDRLTKLNAPQERIDKVKYLLERYKVKIEEWLIKGYSIETRCPSWLVSGGSNFPTRKKEKQNAARDKHFEESPEYLLEQIKSITYNAKTIYSDDENAVERIKEKIKALETMPDRYGNNKAEIRRLKERLLILSPDEVKADIKVTINGVEATYQNIIALFEGKKPHKSRYGGEDFYIDIPLVFSNGKRKYEEYLQIGTDENGETVRTYGNAENNYQYIFLPLTDERKFDLIINKIHGSGNKAVIYSILKDLKPRELIEQAKAIKQEREAAATINGESVTIERNAEAVRLQIFFEGIPQPETRHKMKSNGFVWSPSNKAWQRLLNNNAEYALKNILDKAVQND